MRRRLLGAGCLLIVCGMLVAGLWPFHVPKNKVSWIDHSRGLSFRRYSSIVSAGVLKDDSPQGVGACSLEIWLQPAWADGKGTILGFYQPEGRVVPFAIRQYNSGLVLEHPTRDALQGVATGAAGVYVDRVFEPERPVLVTIASNGANIAVYADGVLVRKAEDFGISSQDCTGRLVAGNSPAFSNSWTGQLRGLAIYHRELSSEEVLQHVANWTKNTHYDVGRIEGPSELFVFGEGRGDVVHDQVKSAPDFIIPSRFFVLDHPFLERPWNEYRPGWPYWKAIGLNIVGFIPLGFLVSAFLSSSRNANRTLAKTILLGFTVSLMIEVFQAFLPTRNSGITDLITNTFGTCIGVILFRYNPFRALSPYSGSSIAGASPALSLRSGSPK
jgi:hypothetical protein